MIGFQVLLNGTDYTNDVINVDIPWPATTGVPTATIQFSNQKGNQSQIPLYGILTVALPNNIGTFNYYYEKGDLKGSGLPGQNAGHTNTVYGTAATELLYLTEGNLSVIGTDFSSPYWNQPANSTVPYVSTFVAGVGTNLMDIGNLLTALVHTPQPNQIAGYRGRLGYDATGTGCPTSTGVDYQAGSLGYYIKGMWTSGSGSTGAQKTGLDLIREACTKNVIDGNGVPNILDFYVDNRQTPSILNAFPRGSRSSGISFTLGTDAIIEADLPVDTTDIKNFVLYWVNAETLYPGGGDAWSNYQINSQFQTQWTNHATGNAMNLQVSTNTPYSAASATSNQYIAASAGSTSDGTSDFVLPINGYSTLGTLRGITKISFWMYASSTSNTLAFNVFDSTGTHNAGGVGPVSCTNVNTWQQFTLTFNTPSFFSNFSGYKLEATIHNAAQTPAGYILVDYIQFPDDWNFSPVYSYNQSGPNAALITNTVSSGSNVLPVSEVTPFAIGAQAIIGTSGGLLNFERVTVNGISAPNLQLVTSTTSLNHVSGDPIIAAIDNSASFTVYGYRIFNFVDFYASSPSSDGAAFLGRTIVNQRTGKKSSGTLTISGYNQGIPSVLPGSVFNIIDPKDIYTGNPSVDSAITGWIADQVEYTIDSQMGFRASYTIEPFYNQILSGSPDSNSRNYYRYYNRTPAGMLNRLYRMTQNVSPQG